MDASVLSRKVILILTPQAWGNMMLAKHHYAIELAKKGSTVYYLNPPDNHHWSQGKKRIQIKAVPEYPNLFIIHQQLYFPYKIKFHSRKLYNVLVRKQVRDILSNIPKPVDMIWSFDLGNLFPISFFDSRLFKIFHPVDEPADKNAFLAAKDADILFSVTKEIIEKYEHFGIPSFFINHGLAEDFFTNVIDENRSEKQISVGLSGNFLRPDLDRKIITEIIHQNPEIVFHFFGSYTLSQSNIGAEEDEETRSFIQRLQILINVKFHGVLRTAELARALNQMDALLICYDMERDQSKGTNYHKVMEYLSTGKVIIANNISTYKSYPDMIRMTASRINNEELPALFQETIRELEKWNAKELVDRRKAFARDNTYSKQLERIEWHIRGRVKDKLSIL